MILIVSVHFLLSNCSKSPTGLEAQANYIKQNAIRLKGKWGDDAIKTFEWCFFLAMSLAAENPDVFLFTPKGVDWKKESAWWSIEYPALTQNQNVYVEFHSTS